MNPKIWGRPGWTMFFSIVTNYPENPNLTDMNNYKIFFTDVQYILPCQICCENYTDHLRQIPIEPYLANRKSLFAWLLKIHNEVNKHQKKPPMTESNILSKYLIKNKTNINGYFQHLEYSIWKFIFSIAYGYPQNPSKHDMFYYKRFFHYLQFVFPDPIAQKHYSRLLINLGIDGYLNNSEDLFAWVANIYNGINTKINQPTLTVESAKKFFFPELYPSTAHYKQKLPTTYISAPNSQTSDRTNILQSNISIALVILFLTSLIYRKCWS